MVIGGGLIGLSVTEALTKRGLKVTMVELQDKILSLLLDPKASELVESVVRAAGVDIVTGQSVQKIIGKPGNEAVVGGVVLTKGATVPCDLVIAAIGVIPRTDLAVGTAIKTKPRHNSRQHPANQHPRRLRSRRRSRSLRLHPSPKPHSYPSGP